VATLNEAAPQTTGTDVKPGVIEILNRSGQVMQRIHYHGGEVRVGRAYDNDIIIGDPYVCPHHLTIRSEQGRLVLVDLDSVNGTWNMKGRVRLNKVQLCEGERVQFGHSQLRFRPIDSSVEPAWRDTARLGLFHLLGKPWMLPLAAVLCITALSLEKLLDSSKALGPGVLASQLVYPLLGIMVWAGFWSLLNRLIAHRGYFNVHLAIAALAVVALFVNAQAVPLMGFALGWSSLVGWLKILGQIAILGLALFTHMQFATHGRTRAQAFGSGVLATLLIGAPMFGELLQRNEFSSLPKLDPLLKPPVTRLVNGASVEDFFLRAENLREELEKDVSE